MPEKLLLQPKYESIMLARLASPKGPLREDAPMNRSYRNWYLLVALLVVVPVGARVLMWKKLRPQAVDPAMAQAGGTLFTHEWTPNDPLAAGGDGLGPV